MPSRWSSLAGLFALGIGILSSAAGAQQLPPPPGQDPAAIIRVAPGADWRSQADARDRTRLDTLPATWAEALESARRGGHAPAVAAAGALLDSRAGLAGAHPHGGLYRCRSLRVGAVDPEAVAFIAYPAFRCRIWVNAGLTFFEKATGSQRTAGVIFPDGPTRSVLIGTEAVGTETGFPGYGLDGARDRIAVIERIAPDRWRLVFPRPSNGAILEVMELVGPR